MFSRRLLLTGSESSLGALFGESRERSELLDLTASNPTRAGLEYPLEQLGAALARAARFPYSPDPLGLVSAREALAQDWRARGFSVDARDLMLTASTSEAYGLLFKLLCNPGDEVLVPQPSYPLFEVLAGLEGVTPKGYRLDYDGAWFVDLDSVRSQRTEKTRAVVMVSPNNPTGSFLKAEELDALGRLGLPLIADEVFASYVLSGKAQPLSALAVGDALVFALDGLSKRCGLPQMKLSWLTLAGPRALREEARRRLELINDSYLSANGAVQHALPDFLELGRGIQQQILLRCRQNLLALKRELAGSAISQLYLEGGWSAVLRLPTLMTEDDWVLSLLHQQQVLVQPGWFYDFEHTPVVIVSLLGKPDQFQEAVTRLRQHVASKVLAPG